MYNPYTIVRFFISYQGVDGMYEYALTFLNEYVELYTYLSQHKLYGEIVEVTSTDLILQRKHMEKASNKNFNLFIPLNSIISIKKI
jgi:hypothetical protein